MPNRQPSKNASHYQRFTPVNNYINSKQKREQRLWKIRNGILVTDFNGREITAEQFNQLCPLLNPVSFKYSPENADHTRDYLNQ